MIGAPQIEEILNRFGKALEDTWAWVRGEATGAVAAQ